MEDNEIESGIVDLEEKIGLEKGFFRRLLEEDDWSFVIKLHALIEAATAHLLTYHLQEEALEDILARLELSNKTTGKLAFLKKLDLLGKDSRRYISSLSELRNTLVHNVRNCSFNLKDMVAQYTDKELKAFTKTFSPFECKQADFGNKLKFKEVEPEKMNSLMARAKENPKVHVWAGAYNLLNSIMEMHGYSDFRHWEKAKVVFDEEVEV